MFTKGVATAWS